MSIHRSRRTSISGHGGVPLHQKETKYQQNSTFTSVSGIREVQLPQKETNTLHPFSLSRPPFKILMCVLHPQIIKFLLHFLAALSTKRSQKRVGLVKNSSGCFKPLIVWWIRSANFAPIEKGMKNE